MKIDTETVTADDLCIAFPLLKHRLFQLGLLKSAHAFDEAQNTLGWERAEQREKEIAEHLHKRGEG